MAETLYLAGPMTNYPEFNFPAFDRAAKILRGVGYNVISPAEMDRENGFDERGMDGTKYPAGFNLRETLMLDLHMIAYSSTGIATLGRWEQSKGAKVEVALAEALGIPAQPVGLWLVAAELNGVQLGR